MAQLFPAYANTIARLALPVLGGGLVAVAWGVHTALFSSYTTEVAVPKAQPVPFSHQHHVGELGIDCRYCHTGVEDSAFAGLPATEICMTCHSQIWRDASVLEPVRESWRTGRPLRWTRVYDLPDYVAFDHSIHVRKGIGCVSCHGRVDQMPLLAKAASLYMRWCLECHRDPERHRQLPSEVFTMRDEPLEGFGVLREKKQIPETSRMSATETFPHAHRLEDCSICHR